jgi:Rieske Fe-S protein
LEPVGGERQKAQVSTLWPVGFAVGVACLLVGLVVSWVAVGIGAAIAAIFGFLWVRDLSRGVPGPEEAPALPEAATAAAPAVAATAGGPAPASGERYPRSKFLEGATLGMGALIGGIVTIPPIGFLVSSSFFHHDFEPVNIGPISSFPEGKFIITTFISSPADGEVSRRTAYIRNNGLLRGLPSFTIISNHCAHLGCPVQPNGPIDESAKTTETNKAGAIVLQKTPVQAAGFGCPCHGGAYDTEGNRTAGPPVRALDRYRYSIVQGRVVLGAPYSVRRVIGTGKDAKIIQYPLHPPGQHVGDWEQFLWPIPEVRG